MRESEPKLPESETGNKLPEAREPSSARDDLRLVMRDLGQGVDEAVSLFTESAAKKVADLLIEMGVRLEKLRSKSKKG